MAPIYVAADHGGFHLKQVLVAWLRRHDRPVEDLGPTKLDPDDDFPPLAAAVAERISSDPAALGILLCRSGQGMVIVANKYPGVRAAVAWNEAVARAGRADDHANVLSLPADYLTEAGLRRIVAAWLATVPKEEERYRRRLRQIRKIEDENMARVSSFYTKR